MTSRRIPLLLAALMALSLVSMVPMGGTVAADNTTTLDEDTGLTHSDTIDDYESDGVASTSETVPSMTFTIADSSEDVGVSGLRYTDFDTTYLRVEYDESIERTVRFYVPQEYWHPYPDTNEAVSGDATATMEPTEGSNYTAVTIHFEDETDAVFEVKSQASIVFSARDYGESWLEEELGMDLPDTSTESRQWDYVPTTELTNGSPTFGINTHGDDVTIQYDRSNSSDPADTKWRSVPSCSSSASDNTPVCTYTADDPDTVFILSQTSDPPDIRFQHDAGFFADLQASIGELFGDIPSDVLEDARSLIDRVTS